MQSVKKTVFAFSLFRPGRSFRCSMADKLILKSSSVPEEKAFD